MLTDQTRWSLGRGKPLVPSCWQATHDTISNVAMCVKPQAEVAVIIVGHNEEYWIRSCLESVASEVPSDSIFYVDNASSDGTVEMVRRQFSDIQLLCNSKNLGFAGGNNLILGQLLKEAQYRYVFLLNPDTVVPVGLIKKMRDFLGDHPEYAVVGPLQVEYDGARFSDRFNRVSRRDLEIGKYHILKRWLPEVTLHVTDDHPSGVLGVYYVQGSAFFARVAALKRIGIFDELFHSFYEEVDLCRRALWSGYKLGLLTNLSLPHASRGSDHRSRWRLYLRLRNKYLFVLTDPNISIRWLPLVLFRLTLSDIRQALWLHKDAEVDFASASIAILWLAWNVPRIIHGRAWRSKLARSNVSEVLVGRWMSNLGLKRS